MRFIPTLRAAVCLLALLLVDDPESAAAPPHEPLAAAVADVPPPVPPATINRDSSGQATVRGVRLSTALRIDGRLDEAVYTQVPPMSDFIQNDPHEGAPASEKTDVWVFFDDRNVYIVGRCWESRPESIVANEMRRDNVNIVQNDQFAWSIDTFHDRRNMLFFEVSASGGRIDGQVTNERQIALDWNPIWDVKTGRFEGGYVVEAAIPFKSLRYAPGEVQVWGFQVRRRNMAKNEYSYLTPIPASVGSQGHFRAALAATLVGIQAPAGARNLDIKPYVTGNLTTDKAARPVIDNDAGQDVGVDVKYGVTQSLAADFTVNTDFAQVEADEHQVNLTRFNLFFPEKREFFLENAGIFAFGAAAGAAGDTPLLFYSRGIGLSKNREVPIRTGARLSGRSGRFTIGALNVQTGPEEVSEARPTNFSVLRLKRDVLRRGSIGMIATNRSVGLDPSFGANQAYGADMTFSFGSDLVTNAYWAQTRTEGVARGEDTSYRAMFDYNADRYGAQFDHLSVGARFDPQIGFARRRDMGRNFALLRFSPRPTNSGRVRKYSYQATFNNIENTSGRLESRALEGRFGVDLQNSDTFSVTLSDNHEFLPLPFPIPIAPRVIIPAGSYDFSNARVAYNFGRQRPLSGNVSLDYGTFYDGHKTTWSVSSGRFNATSQLSVEPSISVNLVKVSAGEFTATLVTTRTTYTMTPLMFASALLQYSSAFNTFAMNVRFRWEYSPGSELFVVYNDQRDTLAPSFPDLINRAIVVKINRVIRF